MKDLEFDTFTVGGTVDKDGEVCIYCESDGVDFCVYINEEQADDIAAHLLKVFGI